MLDAVDGVVLTREPLSVLRRLDCLRDGIDDRCVRRGVCIGCLWVAAADPVPWLGVFVVLLSLAFFGRAQNQKKSPIAPLEPP